MAHIAYFPRRKVLRPLHPSAAPAVSIGAFGNLLLTLFILMITGAAGLTLDPGMVTLLGCELVLFPCVLGVVLVFVPLRTTAAIFRCGVGLWAAVQALLLPVAPWPVLVLAAGPSLLGHLLVSGLVAATTLRRSPRVVYLQVEPAALPIPATWGGIREGTGEGRGGRGRS